MTIGVMHVVDTLAVGGLERVAVNLANHSGHSGYQSFLCATRNGGPLLNAITENVEVLMLRRRHRFDLGALAKLRSFVKSRRIHIVHAHGSALFAARVATMGLPGTRVIWHAHYGLLAKKGKAAFQWRAATRGISAVIPVSRQLAEWAESVLRVPRHRIWYVPNFVASESPAKAAPLPGSPGYRCVCVANARPEKGLDVLLEAFRLVVMRVPAAHLLIVGRAPNSPVGDPLEAAMRDPVLRKSVTLLGERSDVPAVLAACDIGILSSRVEGLPMALLEYGAAGLGSVCTRVGQCTEVTGDGKGAVLVNPSDPIQLADGIVELLSSVERRMTLGAALKNLVLTSYSVDAAWRSLRPLYEQIALQI